MRADARQIIFTMPSPMDCVKPSTRKTEAILDTGTQSGQLLVLLLVLLLSLLLITITITITITDHYY